jgi:NADH-quinone oxidoreductase subunit G
MARIVVDGTPIEVSDGANLLHALLEAGYDLPYFCWHPALGSVGACRQCAVVTYKDENDTTGELVMACMTPVADGQRVSIEAAAAQEMRTSVIEWLMLNHPHDCPVCDEGGECHLQDMTVMTGHAYRRSRFPKRTYRNQDLGPFIFHEMNRCIQCYRCVRFYRDYAGGHDLDVFGSHDAVYFGRFEDGPLESELSGNLVEVCPTGVFTDKTLRRHYTRKWDLETAPSVCVHCSLGCNTIVGARYGTVRRILNRYHHDVNGYFLCDRGRFGYEHANHERRLRTPQVTQDREVREVAGADALAAAAERLGACDRLIGIGSPRASLEDNFALQKLVGEQRFVTGLATGDHQLAQTAVELLAAGPAEPASVGDLERADVVVVLGEDLAQSAPRAALAVRQASRRAPERRAAKRAGVAAWHDAAIRDATAGERGPVFVITPDATKLDDAARRVRRARPGEIARLALAVAARIDPDAPRVEADATDTETAALAGEIAEALRSARRSVIVSGRTCGDEVMRASAALAGATCSASQPARLMLRAEESNTVGLMLLGGRSLETVANDVAEEGEVGVIVLANDLDRRTDPAAVEQLLTNALATVAIDVIRTTTTDAAGVTLPLASFAEAGGTFVNAEGRAQRSYRVLDPPETVRSGWRWIGALADGLGRGLGWERLDTVLAELAREHPALAAISESAPDGDHRQHGMRLPRQPGRYSGRTAIHAADDVRRPPPPAEDPDGPFVASMEGSRQQAPAPLVHHYRSPGWSSEQALNRFQEEIAGPLRDDHAGVRLLAPDRGVAPVYPEPPQAPDPGDQRLVAVPRHLCFGSEELSALAPGVAERTPEPRFRLSVGDARRLSVEDGERLSIQLSGAVVELPVEVAESLAEGVVMVPVGLDGMPPLVLPAMAVIGGRS